MSDDNWIQFAIEGGGTPGAATVALLSGVEFRRAGAGNIAPQGKVLAIEDGLVLEYTDGARRPLTAEFAQALQFNVPHRPHAAVNSFGARDEQVLVAIIAACPRWARHTVAKHIMPERFAAWERHKASVAEKARATRIAQLTDLGRIVSGKAADAPELKISANPADERAARTALLRGIGQAVSR